ncbi:MAG: TlpA family protein disulfide reductase [Bacteroidaceae bacterium]|nr:TlpA family protein disulfide reductase [Bacteroidaceae bacterium]
MMNVFMRYIIAVLLLTMVSCMTEEELDMGSGLQVGDKLPAFSVVMSNGEKVESNDLLGNVSIIVFFNTACKDCQQELPVIQRFYDSHSQYPLICISREESVSSVATYWEQKGFTVPYSAQEDRKIFELFAKSVVPRIYIVDEDGIIRYIFTDNPLATFDDLVEAIKTI